MHADLETTLNELRTVNEGWLTLVGALTESQANWRPSPQRWSIAQCMDHVNVTTGKLLGPLQQAIEDARAIGKTAGGPFHYGFIARWFLNSLEPSARKSLPAPSAYRPAASDLDMPSVTADFTRIQAAFEESIMAADGLDLAHIRVASPAFALLRLPLGIWFLSTASHTHRHLNQARRVRNEPRFPG